MLLVLPHFSHTRVPLPLSFAYIFLMFMVTFPSDLPRMTCRMLNSLCASRHPVHQYGLTPVAPFSCSTWPSIAITNCRRCVHLPMRETSVIRSIDPECLR